MARSPDRKRNVFFLGAGFGKAAGLPNTAELLTAVHDLSEASKHWGVSQKLGDRLETAYVYFYPNHGSKFRPEVSDFFSVLSTYAVIARGGLPQGFPDRRLLVDLKFAITKILSDHSRAVGPSLADSHELLDKMVRPGNVIVTSNWDLLIERIAEMRKVPLRLSGTPTDSALALLKLHGSIDWTLRSDCKKAVHRTNYSSIDDLLFSARSRRHRLDQRPVIRSKAIERWTRAYQVVKGATGDPYMLTMARGKSDLIEPLMPIWMDAYRALSSASTLHIIGYSMPDDDTEIRTLLRAGYERGTSNPTVIVKNPAPEVHVRIRTQVTSDIESDYAPVPPIP